MIKFLFKGVFRDRQRSLLPVVVVTIGVMLTVLVHTWVTGILGDMIDVNAKFTTGHVKIMSRAYLENEDQIPNDLALLEADNLIENINKTFPDMLWVKRIRFGGLLDTPDEIGETKAQGPAMGLAVDLLSKDSSEKERLNIETALIRGALPGRQGEILLSDKFATRLQIVPGDQVTLISSTMYGGMAIRNFFLAGTVKFGVSVMDRGAMIIDIKDAEQVLDMEKAVSELLGYFKTGFYDDKAAEHISREFNAKYLGIDDEFAPVMIRLREQNDLAGILDYVSVMISAFIIIFVVIMSIVLWNAGLIGGLRRYGEIGVRLAIGENKGHIYRTMIFESLLIGIAGSVLGTIIGLGIAWPLQVYGFDYSSFMKNTTMMIPTVYRAQITIPAYFIGYLPGLVSTVLGTMLSGIGIYKRQTAQLFKELEV